MKSPRWESSSPIDVSRLRCAWGRSPPSAASSGVMGSACWTARRRKAGVLRAKALSRRAAFVDQAWGEAGWKAGVLRARAATRRPPNVSARMASICLYVT
jgi:hypothetical protein